MSKVFVVRNQSGLFASKQKEWLDGREPKLLFRSPHKDEAINLVFELSSKDIYLRAEAISVALNDKKQPIVEVTAEVTTEITTEITKEATAEPSAGMTAELAPTAIPEDKNNEQLQPLDDTDITHTPTENAQTPDPTPNQAELLPE